MHLRMSSATQPSTRVVVRRIMCSPMQVSKWSLLLKIPYKRYLIIPSDTLISISCLCSRSSTAVFQIHASCPTFLFPQWDRNFEWRDRIPLICCVYQGYGVVIVSNPWTILHNCQSIYLRRYSSASSGDRHACQWIQHSIYCRYYFGIIEWSIAITESDVCHIWGQWGIFFD